ncbi:hypothetical protein BHE74_00015344 [Ensete ventricosum]|nr:hypothetical protein BHE74_00015344 [Ensete ventricosum]
MTERHVSDTTELMMAERHVSGTTELTMAEGHVSSTTELKMAEGHVLGTTESMMTERHVSGTTELMMAERCISGTIELKMAEGHVSGTTELMMAERHVSGTIELMMTERYISGTTELMMPERHISGTTELMMTKRYISGTTELMMAERHVSGTTELTMVEGHVSGTTELKMAEGHVSGTTELMMAKRHVSGTTELMMTERCVSGTIELMMAEGCFSGTIELMMVERHVSGMTTLMMLKGVHREHPSVYPHSGPSRAAPVVLAVDGHGHLGLTWSHIDMVGSLGGVLSLPPAHEPPFGGFIIASTTARDLTCSSELHLLLPQLFAVLLPPSPLLLQTGRMSSLGSSSVRVIPSASSEGMRSEGRETSVSGSSHSGIPSPEDARSRRDLEVMKSCHDIASVISEEALESNRECYSILEGYALRAPSPEQRPYQPKPSEISISIDALEAGLRFPLHSTIVECLRWWRIFPSQMAPNSWRYLIAFLGECRGAGIVPSRTLFFTCFHLCKSRGGYYLMARVGFKVSGAPTNNKGWKAQYFFVSGPSWGFRADWSIHPISNVPPLLFEESCCGQQVEGSPSPFPGNPGYDREVVGRGWAQSNFPRCYGSECIAEEALDAGGKGAPVASPEGTQPKVEVTHMEALGKRPAGSPVPDQTVAGRPGKRVKIAVRKHKAYRGEGSSRRAARERESEVSTKDSSPTYRQPKSMRDLCDMRVREDDEGYYVLQMADWAPRDSSAMMRARWSNLPYQT